MTPVAQSAVVAPDLTSPQPPRLHSAAIFLSRILFLALTVLASFCCLVYYLPFTYFWLVRAPGSPAIEPTARAFPFVFSGTALLLAFTLWRELRQARTQRLAAGLVLALVALGALLLSGRGIRDLSHDVRSYIWAWIALFPALWLAAVDFRAAAPPQFPAPADLGRRVIASLGSGVFLGISYSVAAAFHVWHGGLMGSPTTEVLASAGEISMQILVGLIVAALFALMHAASRRSRSARWILSSAAAIAVGAFLFRKLVLAEVAFNAQAADFYAVAVCATIVLAIRSPLLRTGPPFSASTTRAAASLCLVAALLCVFIVPGAIGTYDWNALGKNLAVVAAWLLTLGAFSLLARPLRSRVVIAAVLATAAFAGATALVVKLHARLTLADAIDRRAAFDNSYSLIRQLAAPALDDARHAEFYDYLRANTDISAPVDAGRADMRLAGDLSPSTAPVPNIFILVIDSLRADYVSAYNPAVHFTPALQRFAGESTVFRNAYAAYTGTTLSTQSLWVGGLTVHKQELDDAWRISNLSELLRAHAYAAFVTADPIARRLLPPSAPVHELERDVKYFTEYSFAGGTAEFRRRLDAGEAARSPVFLFLQPQDVHLVTLARHKVHPAHDYPGFDARVATAVESVDRSFGEFIDALRAKGLYDDSIIVVTADHGDSYGSMGRLGHTITISPEASRVPLIIHLPARLRELATDVDEPALLTDITPTLFYLLGHRNLRRDSLLGRPLFAHTHDELAGWFQPSLLLASSYNPTYAVLSGHGRYLSTVSAVQHSSQFFDLATDPNALRNRITEPRRAEAETFIRSRLQMLRARFGLPAQ